MGEGHDVFISYAQDDLKFAQQLAGKLSEAGLNACVPKDTEPGEAAKIFIKCKVLVSVMSASGVTDKGVRDMLSLAYISDRPIFPVGLAGFSDVAKHMDGGLKLMVAKINWTFFKKSEDMNDNLPGLIDSINSQVAAGREGGEELTDDTELTQTYFTLNRGQEGQEMGDVELPETEQNFWDRHFGEQDKVELEPFKAAFIEDYRGAIEAIFVENSQRVQFINLLGRDVFEDKRLLTRQEYLTFCGGQDGPHRFFLRTRDYAVGSFAIREVFDMDSTVRYSAVENLAQFQTRGVLRSLLDLLRDQDPNLRAIAAVSLGRTGVKHKTIVKQLAELLNDEDRLVRESACLSLGHLKAVDCTHLLLNSWRNDPISHVRAAAEVAVKILGGSEAEQALKVIKVLTNEMSQLKVK